MITLQFIEELKRAAFTDFEQFDFLDHHLIADGSFKQISLDENEVVQYLNLLRNLESGEASCLAAAMHRNGIVATDDRMARNSMLIHYHGVPFVMVCFEEKHYKGEHQIFKFGNQNLYAFDKCPNRKSYEEGFREISKKKKR
ncbi:MAG: hypothetical protein ACHQUC_02735 [Chlamydiales bacterium]